MKINCIIIDDEPLARKGLAEYVKQIDYLILKGTAKNINEGVELINKEPVDLIFLDIQMPQITGIDFLKNFKPDQFIVITTAYPEYALEGYELNILDYLLKPINFERFLKATEKAIEYFNFFLHQKADDFIFLKSGNKIEKIFLNEILFVEGLSNYIKVHTLYRNVIHYGSLSSFEKQLELYNFMRVHRSFIVNLEKVITIEKHCLRMNTFSIPVSDSYRNKLIEKIRMQG